MLSDKVSIIIPVYNGAKYLIPVLDSCLGQSYTRLEILLVNDGSTDNSKAIIKSYSDSRIKYLEKENKGAASARNLGIENANGEFIQFLDADDVLHRDKIALQIRELEKRPKGTIASCSWSKFHDSTDDAVQVGELVWKDYRNTASWLIDSWLGDGMMQTACWLIPRVLVDEAGLWNESLSLHDDGEYFTRILIQATSIKFVSDAMVYYRQVKGSLSRIRNAKAVESAYKVTDLSVHHLLGQDNSDLARKASARHYGRFAYEFYQENRELANDAIEKMKSLYSSRGLLIGPKKFNALARLIGLKKALQLRCIFKC